MYQIFPDRFNKSGECDLSGKLAPYHIHENPSDVPEYRPDENGEVKNCDFFGGNLKGITEKIGYLKSLGVGTLYLNPIFKAYSNHRYDTFSYRKIDEMLGNEDDLAELCKVAKKNGIKIILDGVFSHTGSNSEYFNSAVSDGNSPYFDWYSFERFPDRYTSWWGIKTLPCVNENAESYLDYQIRSSDSTLCKWMKCGVDGFRLDVADELPDVFIELFNAKMKEIRPDSLLIGEVWEDASNKISYSKRRTYFTENELDSVMNYPFRNVLIAFVTGKDGGEELRRCVLEICENYPHDVVLKLMNFLSTHDTPRILTVLSGETPGSKEERAFFRLCEKEYEKAEKMTAFAYSMLYMLPGCPCIYYGDEIGSEGFEDPFCRGYFDWNKKSALTNVFKALAALRESEVLRFGDTDVEVIGQGVVKIIRKYGNKAITGVFNASDKAIPIEENAGDILFSFGVNNGYLPPYSLAVCKLQ